MKCNKLELSDGKARYELHWGNNMTHIRRFGGMMNRMTFA